MVVRRLTAWIVVWALTAVGMRATLLAPEVCPAVDLASVERSIDAAASWIEANQAADGRYEYELRLEPDGRVVPSADYNIVRHAGTTMALYQLVAAGRTEPLAAADRGLAWMEQRLVPAGDARAVAEAADDAKLGTAALLVAGLVHRRTGTGDRTHDVLLADLGAFMVSMQRPDGSMLDRWNRRSDAPVPDATSLFATGEALWAFTLLDGVFPDAGYAEAAWRTLDYLATSRDEDEDVWPRPWADQWAAYAIRDMAPWGGLTDRHITYAKALAGQFGVATRWESQRNGGIDGLVHKPESIAAGQGTWLEALGSLGVAAAIDPRLGALESDLADRLLCGAGRMIEKQTIDPSRPELHGAWFVKGVTRVDGQQHVISGLLAVERLLKNETGNAASEERR